MKIKKNITCVSDFLRDIDELNMSYTVCGMSNKPTECKFLYRGHSDKDYPLIPSLFRETRDIDITIDDYIDNTRYDLASPSSEKKILQAFIAEACAYIRKDPSDSFYEWAQYAQHYGAPTRFLDLTENPLVALYFACKENKPTYQNHGGDIGGKDGCIWMLHLGNYRKFANQTENIIFPIDQKCDYTIAETIEKIYQEPSSEPIFKYPIIFKPYYVDKRMSAQSSMFMVWGREICKLDVLLSKKNRILRSNKERSGERGYSLSQENQIAYKFLISNCSKQQILRELDHCGINEKTLFPCVDGIGRYIEMKYRFDLEESKYFD